MEEIRLLLTTVDDEKTAHRLAEQLVDARLAACVQVSPPVVSHYRWQGKQERAREYRLEIKTLAEVADAAVAWLREHHPYDTPEVVMLDAGADAAYAAWMRLEQEAARQ